MRILALSLLAGGMAAGAFGGAGQLASTTNATSQVVERGPHHRVVETTRTQVDAADKTVVRKGRYTELRNGMHYLEQGEWRESQETIEAHVRGAAALKGPHKVIFSANLMGNRLEAAVDALLPDNQRLGINVVGLAWNDPMSGRTVWIGRVKDAVGVILPPNQVLYADAFEGILADVRLTYTTGGLESDVILRERPVPPKDFSPETAMLQVVTEFIGVTPVVGKERLISTESAQPSRGAPPGGGLLADCQLVFGPMQMTRGRAFAVAGRAQAGQPSPTSVPVGKQWHQMDGRGLLIESVEYAAILPHLEALQTRAARGEPKAKERRAAEAGQRPEAKPMRTAARVREETGFVIDWILVASSTNTTFATDQTYKVASEVTLSTYIAFQAGTIVKFTPQGSLTLLDPIAACPDLLVPRAVLTHAYDDSIGEPITSGDPEANKYPWALFMESCAKCYPQRLEIRYAQAGMKVDDGEVAAKNCLWRKCTYGVRATAADVTFDGVFMCDVNTLTFDDGGASFFGVDDIVTECSIDLWAPEIVTPPHQVHLSSTT